MKKMFKTLLALTLVVVLAVGSSFAGTPSKTKVPTLNDLNGFFMIEGKYNNMYASVNAKTKKFTIYGKSENANAFDKEVTVYDIVVAKKPTIANALQFDLKGKGVVKVPYVVTVTYLKNGTLDVLVAETTEEFFYKGTFKKFNSLSTLETAAKKTKVWERDEKQRVENEKIFADYEKTAKALATIDVIKNATYAIPEKSYNLRTNPEFVNNYQLMFRLADDGTQNVTFFYEKDGGTEGFDMKKATVSSEEVNGSTVMKFVGTTYSMGNSETPLSEKTELTVTFKNAGTITKIEVNEEPFKANAAKITKAFVAASFE